MNTPPGLPRLLILSWSRLVSDARVLRQITLFSSALGGAYDVTTVGYGPSPAGVASHVQVPDDIVHWHRDRGLMLFRRFQRAFDTAPVTAWAWSELSEGALQGRSFDVVLANDIDTVPVAVRLRESGRAHGVHADLHEFSPGQNEESRRWRIFVAPYFRFLVRRWATRADSVTTVGQGLARQYQKEFGLAAGVVVNAPPRADLQPTPVSWPPRLVHAGNAVPQRLEVMLEAMDLVTSGATLDLYLVGQDTAYLDALRQRYAASDRVRVHDPVPPEQVVATLAGHDVGVYVLPPISFNFRWALPNKFFDFVQARLALMVGPSPEMDGLVREHHLGVVTDDFSAASLAAAIDALTPQVVVEGKAASHVAAGELCAERQVQGWVEAVAALLPPSGDSDSRA